MGVFVVHGQSGKFSARLQELGVRCGRSFSEARESDTVVCWGLTDESTHAAGRRVMNSPERVQRAMDQERLIRFLRLYRLPVAPPNPGAAAQLSGAWLHRPASPRCRVFVFDMQVVRIEQDVRDAEAAPAIWTRRAGRLAVSAVYAAGLDYGIAVLSRKAGQPAVETVELPSTDADAAPFLDAIAALHARLSGDAASAHADGSVIRLGMDPEFLLVNDEGKVVPASRFLPRRGSAGYDSVSVRGRTGVHPLAELRPEPSSEPAELIRNLRRTMWTASGYIRNRSLRWVAGGMPVRGLPLGGHVHLSGVPLTTALVRALDNYLALPLVLAEHPNAGARRKRYGRPGDVREKSYGGFEYRSLPSLLMSPVLTKGAVALTKLIAMGHSRLQRRSLDEEQVLAAYMNGDKSMLAPFADEGWREIEALPEYADYASYLAPLKRWLSEQRTWDEGADFRIVWRIPPFR